MRITGELVQKALDTRRIKYKVLADFIPLNTDKLSKVFSRTRKFSADEAERVRLFLEENAPEFIKDKRDMGETLLSDFPLLGTIQGGIYKRRGAEDESQDEPERIPMPSPSEYPKKCMFALKVNGDSVDKLVSDGGYVLCLNLDECPQEIEQDEYYAIESWRGDAVETTLKQARKGKRGWEFWPDSTNPVWKEPVKLGRHEGEIIKLKALMLGAWKWNMRKRKQK